MAQYTFHSVYEGANGMAENQYDAIVIGAGHNGLTTAGYLAKDGLSVLVLERLDKIGGAATTDEFTQGFNGPMCSYIQYMLQGKVIDDLKLREHGLEVLKGPNKPGSGEASMSGIHPFPDGTFTGGPDIKSPLDAAEQIRQFSENDARNYFEWTSFWEQAASILHKTFLAEPPTVTELIESVKGTRQEEVLEKMLTWSVMDLIDDHFEQPPRSGYVAGHSGGRPFGARQHHEQRVLHDQPVQPGRGQGHSPRQHGRNHAGASGVRS